MRWRLLLPNMSLLDGNVLSAILEDALYRVEAEFVLIDRSNDVKDSRGEFESCKKAEEVSKVSAEGEKNGGTHQC